MICGERTIIKENNCSGGNCTTNNYRKIEGNAPKLDKK